MADMHTFFDTCREFCQMVRKIVIYPTEDSMDPRQTLAFASAPAAAPDQDHKTNL